MPRSRGSIVDPLGARVAGASVTLLHDGQHREGNQERREGEFAFDALPEGRYQIRGERPRGFRLARPSRCLSPPVRARPSRSSLPIGPLETERHRHRGGDRRAAIADRRAGDRARFDDARRARQAPTCSRRCALVPARVVVQTGGRGGTTSIFIRGGNSNFNKMLIDGVPANDIGGGFDFARSRDDRRRAGRGAARSEQRDRRHRRADRRHQHHDAPRTHAGSGGDGRRWTAATSAPIHEDVSAWRRRPPRRLLRRVLASPDRQQRAEQRLPQQDVRQPIRRRCRRRTPI